MRYFGGKARIGKQLAEIINGLNPKTYWEPFCGMFSVGKHVKANRVATDAQEDLILLLDAIKNGFKPPTYVSEESYNGMKKLPPSAFRGFVGFGCSFAGKFFGGYARDKDNNNYAEKAARSLDKLRPIIQDVAFGHVKYNEANIFTDVIYCDPPYKGTTKYTVDFRSDDFWKWVKNKSCYSVVLVSEYEASEDFVSVWSKDVKTDMHGKDGKLPRVEHLFVHKRYRHLFDNLDS